MNIKIVNYENTSNAYDFHVEYYINDEQIGDQHIDKLKQAIHTLVDKENNREMLIDIVEDLVRDLGETRSIEKKMLETTSSIEL